MGSSLACCLKPEEEQEEIQKITICDKETILAMKENLKNGTWVDLRDYGIDFDEAN